MHTRPTTGCVGCHCTQNLMLAIFAVSSQVTISLSTVHIKHANTATPHMEHCKLNSNTGHCHMLYTSQPTRVQDLTTGFTCITNAERMHRALTLVQYANQKAELSDFAATGTWTTRRHILLLFALIWYKQGVYSSGLVISWRFP